MNINIPTVIIEGGTLLASSLICNELLYEKGKACRCTNQKHNKGKRKDASHLLSKITPLTAAIFVAVLHLGADIITPNLVNSLGLG